MRGDPGTRTNDRGSCVEFAVEIGEALPDVRTQLRWSAKRCREWKWSSDDALARKRACPANVRRARVLANLAEALDDIGSAVVTDAMTRLAGLRFAPCRHVASAEPIPPQLEANVRKTFFESERELHAWILIVDFSLLRIENRERHAIPPGRAQHDIEQYGLVRCDAPAVRKALPRVQVVER
jgi:hypothetical protein